MTQTEQVQLIEVSENIRLDDSEIQFQFIRASGPGGQNVNKVATAVQLRFDVQSNRSLSGEVKQRLGKLAGRRMNSAGILRIEAKRFRSQEKNRRDAMDRLLNLIRQAEVEPKIRKKKKTSGAAKEKRLAEKRKQSKKKLDRKDAIDKEWQKE